MEKIIIYKKKRVCFSQKSIQKIKMKLHTKFKYLESEYYKLHFKQIFPFV
jgi:hypothetical protein